MAQAHQYVRRDGSNCTHPIRVGEQVLAPWGRRIHAAAAALDEQGQRAVTRYLSQLLDDPQSAPPPP